MTAAGGAHRARCIYLAGSQERQCGTDRSGVSFHGQFFLVLSRSSLYLQSMGSDDITTAILRVSQTTNVSCSASPKE